MKILFISSYLPYPLFSGGHVRLYNILKELSEKHEITLICEKRESQTFEDIDAVKKICHKIITVDRLKQWRFSNIARAGFSTDSFLVTGHTTSAFQRAIKKEIAKKQYDLIHVETYYVIKNLPRTRIPIVLAEHNIEYNVYEKYKERAPFFLRPLLALDIKKMKTEEQGYWREVDAVVAVSREDKAVMNSVGVYPKIIANGVNIDEFVMKDVRKSFEKKEKKVLFIGDFAWLQNRDSVKFIIEEIWPLIRKKLSAKLWIVARNIPDAIRALSNDSSVLFDESSSARSTPHIFQDADVLLAPIRVGGGTSYKILEAMACGTPVVTMPLSADALEAKNGQELFVGKNAKELAEKTLTLLSDADIYESISKKGRSLIEKKYTWKEIGKKLDEVYERCMSIDEQNAKRR
jgi:glycosyltransferase involved in cell wall biosynthesis